MSPSTAYRWDPRRSRFTIKVRAGGVLSGLGHNPTIAVRKFSGTFAFGPDSPRDGELQISVLAESLEVADDMSKKDRQEIEQQMRDDVLEVEKFPAVTFQSTNIAAEAIDGDTYQLEIEGDLSLHGVTRHRQIQAQAKVRPDEVTLRGEFSLQQSDYNVKRVTALAGTLKVLDELQIAFEIRGAAH